MSPRAEIRLGLTIISGISIEKRKRDTPEERRAKKIKYNVKR
jgi:hypothetical protein